MASTCVSDSELTVGGDIDLLWQLCYVDLEAVLNIIQDLRVILVRHKGDGQTFGPESTSTGHLESNKAMIQNVSSMLTVFSLHSFLQKDHMK